MYHCAPARDNLEIVLVVQKCLNFYDCKGLP